MILYLQGRRKSGGISLVAITVTIMVALCAVTATSAGAANLVASKAISGSNEHRAAPSRAATSPVAQTKNGLTGAFAEPQTVARSPVAKSTAGMFVAIPRAQSIGATLALGAVSIELSLFDSTAQPVGGAELPTGGKPGQAPGA